MVSLRTLFGENGPVLRDQNYQLLLLANILPALGTALFSPVLDALIEPFGASPSSIGLFISAFTAPAIGVIPVAGLLADRWGRKPLLVTGLVAFGSTGTAIAFTTDFSVALGLRFLQGAGFAFITPVIITSIGDIYGGTAEATAQGLRFTTSGLSQTFFPFLAGVLVALAWQYPLLLYALAFPVAALVYVRFDEPTTTSPSRSESVTDGGTTGRSLRDLFELVSRRRVWALVIARCLPEGIWIAFLTYNSIIVVQLLDGTPVQAGVLTGIGSLSYAGAATQAGRITAVFDERLYPLVGANLALGGGFTAMVLAPSVVVGAVGIAVTGCGFGMTLSLYRSIITGLAPTSLRGSLVSLAEAGGRLSSTLSPIVVGGIIAFATPVFGFESAVRVAGVSVSLFLSGGGVLCLLLAYSAPSADG